MTTDSARGTSERSQYLEHGRCSARQKRRAPPHHSGVDELSGTLFALLDHLVFARTRQCAA